MRMRRRCPDRAKLTLASAALIASMLSPIGPALPEDAQTSIDESRKMIDAKVAAYLQKHPVRSSLLYESVSSLSGTLGETYGMAIHECEDEPVLPDWQEQLPGLHENTVVALGASLSAGFKRYLAATPAGQPIVGGSLCAQLMGHYAALERAIKAAGPALRKQGY
jgi:hypothetical protein